MLLSTNFTADKLLSQRTKFANQAIAPTPVTVNEITTSEKGNAIVVLAVHKTSQRLKCMGQQLLEAAMKAQSLNLFSEDPKTKVISFDNDIVFTFSCDKNWSVTVNPVQKTADNTEKIAELQKEKEEALSNNDYARAGEIDAEIAKLG